MLLALRQRAGTRRRRRSGAIVALVAACLAVAVLWPVPKQDDPARSPSARAVVLVPQRQTLPDGTVVELRTGATITVDYSGPVRRVKLRDGEALFAVAPDKARAFVVTAAGVDVRAVGTAFAVGIGHGLVDVVVTEGTVAVQRAAPPPATLAPASAPPPRPDAPTLVDAGNRLTVVPDADLPPGPTAISPDDLAVRLAWRAPRLEFSETPLAEAVSLFNRYAAKRLVIADPALAQLHVNGLFRADNAETFVRLLEAGFGVTATRTGDTIRLARPP